MRACQGPFPAHPKLRNGVPGCPRAHALLPPRGGKVYFPWYCDIIYFNSRSPRGERLPVATYAAISSTFQSTLPSRGATLQNAAVLAGHDISIHAPLAGSDHEAGRAGTCANPFQSTLPSRGATAPANSQPGDAQFQSTLPSRGATVIGGWTMNVKLTNFNPRSPRGERR